MAALAGCQADEEYPAEAQPGQEWKAFTLATRDSVVVDEESDAATRALFYGGNGRRFYTLWDQGDQVTVYKNGTSVGTMSPTTYGTLAATLTGTLTGSFAKDDVLDVYLPSAAMDFTGQKGTIYDLSANFSYQHATAKVQEAANQILSLSNVNPSHRQEYLRFVLTDETGETRLHPSRLELHAVSGGHIAASVAANGTVTPTDVLTIEPEVENGEYPGELFVALLNDDDATVTYRIKATVGSDVYVGPVAIDGQNALSRNSRSYLGRLNRALRKMRLTSPVENLNLTAVSAKTFTGSAIVPAAGEVILKDGETTLVQGTDYSYAATDNVNVGQATLTVTGMAMSGDRAETKYLGQKSIQFQITKATPVIVLDGGTADMNLAVGGPNGSRPVSRVFIDNNGNGTWDAGTDFDITGTVNSSIVYAHDQTGVVVTSGSTVLPAAQGTAVVTVSIPASTNWTAASIQYNVNVQNSTSGTLPDYEDPNSGGWNN